MLGVQCHAWAAGRAINLGPSHDRKQRFEVMLREHTCWSFRAPEPLYMAPWANLGERISRTLLTALLEIQMQFVADFDLR